MSKKGLLYLWLFLSTTLPVWGQAKDSWKDQTRELIRQKNWTSAIEILKKQEHQKDPEVAFFLGHIYFVQKEYQKSLQSFQEFLSQVKSSHPKRRKALFYTADCYAALKDYKKAVQVYAKEARFLLSSKERDSLAGIYLSLANSFLKPNDKETKPNYYQASQFFQKALEMGLTSVPKREIHYRIGYCEFNRRDYYRVITLFSKEVKEPYWEKTGEMVYMLGKSYFQRGDRRTARKVLRDFQRKHPKDTFSAKIAYQIAKTYGVPYPAARERELAVRALEEFIQKYPTSPQVVQAFLEIGESYFNTGLYSRAVEEFGRFLKTYEGNPTEKIQEKVARALRAQGQALLYQKKYLEALAKLRSFQVRFPADPNWNQVQRMAIDIEYTRGQDLYIQKKYPEAKKIWQTFLNTYPLDYRCPSILFEFGRMEYNQKKFKEALGEWKTLISKYPNTSQASHAQYLSGYIWETKLKDYKKSLEIYQKVQGAYYSAAWQRIQAMKNPSLMVQGKKVFSTAETAEVEVSVRNISEFEIQVYRVDLRDYFSRMQTSRGVVGLDIGLIEPDWKITHKVKDFRKYAPFTLSIPLKKADQGLYVVKGVAKTLETTTLLAISDLGLMVKASRQDLFIFTQNLRENSPQGGVSLLISDGKRIFLKGKTDSQGIFHQKVAKLKDLHSIRVLAAFGSLYASQSLSLQGLALSPHLEKKAFLYTERPLYHPGDKLYYRALLRKVSEGKYTLPDSKEKYKVTLFTSLGEVLSFHTHHPSSFGTLFGKFSLPSNAPLGTYRLMVEEEGKDDFSFSTSFQVNKFELQNMELRILPDRRVHVRGEELSGKIRLRYFYGAPVTEKRILYRLGNRPFQEEKTDARGEISFKFSTEDFDEEDRLSLEAKVPDEGMDRSLSLYLSPQEYTLSLSLMRDVFTVDEKFEVSLEAKNMAGEPLSSKARLEVFQIKRTGGREGRVRVKEASITTSALGEGKALLSLGTGGSYLLRATGKDRYGNRILAERKVFISGDEDKVKVRFLTDKQRWKVGSKASLQIVSRLKKKSLALLTWEGEVIHRYSILYLEKGKNTLTFPVKEDLFPNFSLSLSILDRDAVHQASQELVAEKKLDLTLKTSEKDYAPHDTVEIEITTKDQKGEGVSSEVSVAVVDEALLSLVSQEYPDVVRFFYDQKRGHLLRTGAGYKLLSAGHVQTVSSELLQSYKAIDAITANRSAGQAGSTWKRERLQKQLRSLNRNQPELRNFRGRRQGRLKENRYEESGGQSFGKGDIGDDGKSSLASEGALEAIRALLRGTIFFDGQVITGKDGKGKVKFTLPGNITRYRIIAYGVSKNTLLAQVEKKFSVSKKFFVTLKAPSFLREGDQVKFFLQIHNQSEKAQEAKIQLKISAGNEGRTTHHTLDCPAGKVVALPLSYQVSSSASPLDIVVEVKAGPFSDSLGKQILVYPQGIPVVVGTGGMTRGSIRKKLTLPALKKGTYSDQNLTLSILPSFDVNFVKGVLNRISRIPSEASSQGLILLAALQYLQGTHKIPAAQVQDLEGRLQSLIRFVVTSQNPSSWKGGWAFNQKRNVQPDGLVTAQSLLFLGRAKKAGYPVGETYLKKGIQYLSQAYLQVRDDNARAFYLQVMAELGQGDFAHFNRLYRYRNRLGLYGLARLSLGYLALNRKELAREVAQMILTRPFWKGPRPLTRQNRYSLVPYWVGDPVETLSLCATALIKTGIQSEKIGQAIEVLLQKYSLSQGLSPKGMASLVESVCLYQKKNYETQTRFEMEVRVNDKFQAKFNLTGSSPAQIIQVPGKFLTTDNWVDVRVSGKGKYGYWMTLRGFTKGEVAKKQSQKCWRYYEMAPPQIYSQSLNRGWSVMEGSYKYVYNHTEQLREGDWLWVKVRFSGFYYSGYLVVEEPLPPGATVDPASLSGNYDHFEIHPDKIVFTVQKGYNLSYIQYKLYGHLSGTYQVPPTRVYGLYQPWISTWGGEKKLSVLSSSAKKGTYKFSPNELYEAGRIYFEKKEYKKSLSYLSELFSNYTLRDSYYKETVRMLLYIHLSLGPDKEVVRHFENLKERYPELEIGFEEILKVGEAYIKMEEYERGLYVFRAILESAYLRASKISGDLQSLDKIQEGADVLEKLFWKYPRSLYTGEGLSAYSGLVYQRAALEKDKKKKLLGLTINLLEKFLLYYPDSPIADELSFSLANAYLDLENLSEVLRIAELRKKLHLGSFYLDDFTYLEGYVSFKKKQFIGSISTFQKLARDLFPSEKGEGKSSYANLALYLIGQMYHATGNIQEAMGFYKKVSAQYSDAKEVVEFFEQKVLQAEEIHIFGPEEKAQIKLKHRNLKKVDYKVYPVNLLRLYILRRNLSGVTKVNLAGIKPYQEGSFSLEGTQKYEIHKGNFPLPLKDPGAYLVFLKSESLNTSTLVVISSLKLYVQEDAASGRVRVNGLNRKADKPEEKVYIKVIGQGNQKFRSGWTDVRGVFVADDIKGKTTILAKKGKHYSFFRGTTFLQNYQPEPEQPATTTPRARPSKRKQLDYLKKIRGLNAEVQKGNWQRLRKYFQGKKGVQIEQTK